MILPTSAEIERAINGMVRDGHAVPAFQTLRRLTREDPLLGANVDHFVALFSEMHQVTEALARAVVADALVRGLYLGLSIAEARAELAAGGAG